MTYKRWRNTRPWMIPLIKRETRHAAPVRQYRSLLGALERNGGGDPRTRIAAANPTTARGTSLPVATSVAGAPTVSTPRSVRVETT